MIFNKVGGISYLLLVFMLLISSIAVFAQTNATIAANTTQEAYPSFNISIAKSYAVCQNSEKVIFPELTNYADFPDNFTMSIQGNDFAGLTVNNIALPEMSKTQVPIVIAPKSEGLFDLKVLAYDAYGYFMEGNSVVYVDSCVDRRLDMQNNVIKALNCQSASYPVILSNRGTAEKTYSLEFTGPEWMSLDLPGAIKLSPGQYKAFNIKIDVPCDVKGDFDAQITAKAAGDNLANTKKISIKIYGKNEAYMIGPWYNHPLMIIPKGLLAFLILFVIISVLRKSVIAFSAWSKKNAEENKRKREEKKRIRAEKKAAKLAVKEAKLREKEDRRKAREAMPKRSGKGWIVFAILLLIAAAAVYYFREQALPFILSYKLYFAIGFVGLVLLIVIFSAIKRAVSKKTPDVKKSSFGNIVGFAFLVVLLVGAAAFYYYGNPFGSSAQNEFLKFDTENSVVRNGKIIAHTDSIIPLIIDDKNGEAKFAIDSKLSWIKVDSSELETNATVKRIYLYVKPDPAIMNSNYLVDINAKIDYKGQVKNEAVQIELVNKPAFIGTYLSYGIAGLLFAILLVLVTAAIRKAAGKKKEEAPEEVVFDPRSMKASEVLQKMKKARLSGLRRGKERVRKGSQGYIAVALKEKLA